MSEPTPEPELTPAAMSARVHWSIMTGLDLNEYGFDHNTNPKEAAITGANALTILLGAGRHPASARNLRGAAVTPELKKGKVAIHRYVTQMDKVIEETWWDVDLETGEVVEVDGETPFPGGDGT